MKFIITIEATPEEARHFVGLPDIKPMQDALMKEVQERISGALSAMEPSEIIKTWLPVGIQGIENIQKMIWNQVASVVPGASKDKEGKK